MRLGRMSRAAVFAGAALATTAACGGKKPKAEQIDNQQQSASADAGMTEQTPPDNTNDPNNPNNIPMPYGAPPARKRLV
jgi:hypothetical protein